MPKEELIVTTFVQGDSAGLLDFGVGIPLLCLLHPPPVFLSFRRAGFHLRIFECLFHVFGHLIWYSIIFLCQSISRVIVPVVWGVQSRSGIRI